MGAVLYRWVSHGTRAETDRLPKAASSPPHLSAKGPVAKGILVDPFIVMGIASSDFR